jgi:RHS repeat-associated protein
MGDYSFGFNGKELDKEGMGGGASTYDYGFRIYNSALAKFLSVDPLSGKYPMLTPYQFASNTPIQAIDLDGLEAYFIHGTGSGPERWLTSDIKAGELNEGSKALYSLTNNTSYNASFDWGGNLFNWGNGPFNTSSDRANAANKLVNHIMASYDGKQDITLIGHSHGGNVAIQAIPLLRKKLDESGKSNVKINLLTICTPVDNKKDSSENPSSCSTAINAHSHIYNEIDGIQKLGANVMDFLNVGTVIPESFERSYTSPKTKNYKIDVSAKYDNPYIEGSPTLLDRIGAHSFDMDSDYIFMNIKNGTIKKL